MARGIAAPCLERANFERPELCSALSREYVDAGAELVRTNTFQANSVALSDHGLERTTEALNRAAVRLAREGAGKRAHVLGSIGPVGMRWRSPAIEPERARDAYAEQALALAAEGADALVLETLLDPDEAALALDTLARHVAIPFGVTMSFVGELAEPAAQEVAQLWLRVAEGHGASFYGANCGPGLGGMARLADALLTTRLPVWIAPSAGGPGTPRATPEAFAELGEKLWRRGVSFFGGCCGTDPRFIHALASRRARG